LQIGNETQGPKKTQNTTTEKAKKRREGWGLKAKMERPNNERKKSPKQNENRVGGIKTIHWVGLGGLSVKRKTKRSCLQGGDGKRIWKTKS